MPPPQAYIAIVIGIFAICLVSEVYTMEILALVVAKISIFVAVTINHNQIRRDHIIRALDCLYECMENTSRSQMMCYSGKYDNDDVRKSKNIAYISWRRAAVYCPQSQEMSQINDDIHEWMRLKDGSMAIPEMINEIIARHIEGLERQLAKIRPMSINL